MSMAFGGSSSSLNKKNLSGSVLSSDAQRLSADIQKLGSYISEKPILKNNMLDPWKYKMLRYCEKNGFLLVELKYDQCTNYEGHKILLFKDVTMIDLFNQKLIDPHFLVDSGYHHPIARFVPTQKGWDMGLKIMDLQSKPVYRGNNKRELVDCEGGDIDFGDFPDKNKTEKKKKVDFGGGNIDFGDQTTQK